MRRNRSYFAMLVTLLGLLGFVLAVCIMISLIPVFIFTVVLDVDFNKVFMVVGSPMTLLMVSFWFWRNAEFVRSILRAG
ncbi:hypothetical protein [Serratia proteamaculans]|uniref:hypothetical protein n=1 Tax=Serratia proteamaculans TaxID=28151 RepID=UPI003CFF7DC5